LKQIDANTSGDIDKAIAQFIKEANKKIPKGSHLLVRKADLEIPDDDAIKNYIHWKIMQNFTERGDINVSADFFYIDSGEIFTIKARLGGFSDISSCVLLNCDYNYKLFISMDKKLIKETTATIATTNISVLMREYAITNESLESIFMEKENESILQEWQTKASLKKIEKSIEEEYGCRSLTEQECEELMQECIAELEQSLLSLYRSVHFSKQIEILFDDKNCCNEDCNNGIACEDIGEGTRCRPCKCDGDSLMHGGFPLYYGGATLHTVNLNPNASTISIELLRVLL